MNSARENTLHLPPRLPKYLFSCYREVTKNPLVLFCCQCTKKLVYFYCISEEISYHAYPCKKTENDLRDSMRWALFILDKIIEEKMPQHLELQKDFGAWKQVFD